MIASSKMLQIGDEHLTVMTTSTEMTVMEMKQRKLWLRNDLTEQMKLISESSSEQQAIIESIKGKRDENIRCPLNDIFGWFNSSFRIIFTDITPYEHCAVYSGERDNNRFIIHYGVDILDGVIEEIPFKFESRRQCRINNFLDFIHPPFLPTMVSHRARHMVLRVAKKISESLSEQMFPSVIRISVQSPDFMC
ncbi:hypothetical protein PRIPAC_87964 [Pristionchus pacificus]|uniref:Uncharacterized protein n=1 Tax=Pristionchus pacificus TaxID=54126 RepID=A0A2A6B8K8_PRIPA|nr:hypothetical protein PRIPAC_87964 [Pristionchus pacificus]|eukprot:PDM62204.1 hypothetical protein PRIPAC_51646 [Pristionchus pacificus]